MKVVSYLGGIPNVNKSEEKSQMLKRFIAGVNRHGDTGIVHPHRNTIECDVAVIQGWVHPGSPNSAHLNLRRNVALNLKNKHTIIIDSNLFKYTNKGLDYHRYSVDGVFPTTGSYLDSTVDPARWQKISQEYGITLKDWTQTGQYILVCLQRNNGWSMDGLDVSEWLRATIKRIRKSSDRPILVRPHPGDKNARKYLPPIAAQLKFKISSNNNLIADLQNAWAVVTYNSSPAVAAAIEGVPVFVTDPNPHRSQAFPVANTMLSKLENPDTFKRQEWIEKICMSHWNFDELVSGEAWAHIREYCQ